MTCIQKFNGLLGNINPNFWQPKNLNLAQHTWKQGAFHDWQLSADAPLPFPHQMVEYGAGFPAQKALAY